MFFLPFINFFFLTLGRQGWGDFEFYRLKLASPWEKKIPVEVDRTFYITMKKRKRNYEKIWPGINISGKRK